MPRDRHLLVDAHNVIHAWPELRALLTARGPDAARARLAEWLRPLHDTEGWRLTLVCDGTGEELRIERPGKELTFSMIYGPKGLSADGIIEQIVVNSAMRDAADAEEPAEVVVATRDNLLSVATAAAGARQLTPEGLRDWADHAGQQQSRALEARERRAHGTWKNAVSPWGKLPKIPREEKA